MVALTSLSACSLPTHDSGSVTDYNHVADVTLSGWTESDTLFFPIEVTNPTHIRTPLQIGTTYRLGCSIRMASSYALNDVPMLLVVQQTDTVSGHTRIVRNLMREEIAPQVRDAEGRPMGNTWGSLIDYESRLDQLTIRFDTAGTYRMLLTPRTGPTSSFSGLSAIGLQLHRPL